MKEPWEKDQTLISFKKRKVYTSPGKPQPFGGCRPNGKRERKPKNSRRVSSEGWKRKPKEGGAREQRPSGANKETGLVLTRRRGEGPQGKEGT